MYKGKALLGPVDIFLLIIILLNILDFFEIIGSELDYVKKILSWTLLGYLLYQVSPSRVFFGQRSSDLDSVLIAAYFSMVLKNLISYAAIAYESASSLLRPFYRLLIDHYATYETVTFSFGLVLLTAAALYVTFKVPFDRRSIMGVLHEEGHDRSSNWKLFTRFLMVMLVFLGFFLYIFNMMMEWLAIAIDAPLLLVALFVYSVLFIRHKVSIHRYLNEIGSIGSSFYKSFIDHFRYRETFLLGLCGILVLHLLTDIGNFLIPYMIGIHDQLYFGFLGPGHSSVWTIISQDIASVGLQQGAAVVFLAIANIIWFMLLFVSPAIIWYHLYHHRSPQLPRWLLGAFLTVMPAGLFAPLFTLQRLNTANIIGVDVRTHSLLSHSTPWGLVVGLCAVMLVVSSISLRSKRTTIGLQELWVGASMVFFGAYLWLYFADVATYYQDVVFSFLHAQQYLLALVFFVFEALIIILYVGGFFLLLYELWHRPQKKKNL